MRVQFDLQIKVSMKNTTNSDAEVGWGRIPITTLPGAGRGELTSKKGRRAICSSPLTRSNPSAKKGWVRQGHFFTGSASGIDDYKKRDSHFSLAKEAFLSYNSPDGEARPFLVSSAS